MKLTPVQYQILATIAEEAAKAAGKYIQSRFDQEYQKRGKEGGDSLASQVVTEVDLKAQEIILVHLQESINEFDLGLLTEESVDDHSRLIKDYFWCIDPLDGTLPFTEKRTGYAVSIALVSKSGDPVVAAAYIPDKAEIYVAVKDHGLTINDKPFIQSALDHEAVHWFMDQSLKSEGYYGSVKQKLESWTTNHANARLIIHDNLGGVCNAIGVVSSGRACYFKYPKTQKGCGSIWDYAATRLFFEEAGMVVSNARGEKLHLNVAESTFMNRQGVLFATDKHLAELILSLKPS